MPNQVGFLNLNKPQGFTSHDCVAKIRRIFNIKKVGHGGTLDPLATGVLPIAVGKATRLLQYLPSQKAYQAKIRFGITTTTDDLEGEVIDTHLASNLTLTNIQENLSKFTGKIEQIPPKYSAIKQKGKKLYELARAGKSIEIIPRVVEVTTIEILDWFPGKYPELDVVIYCSPGTYIRAIARDLGAACGVGGTLAALTRTLSCGMNLVDSLSFEEIENLSLSKQLLIPPEIYLNHLPMIQLSQEKSQKWCHGQKILVPSLENEIRQQPMRIHHENGSFLGIGKIVNLNTENILIPQLVWLL